ncbi:hypothetical protein ACFU96_21080 [Streptomyces sp. NPDC057620]|uniref:hypothetical protein n=1 Tax=Streptomyces sp. NPDC057620 TaxID=3346185 RepID=UPI0036BC0C54
MLIRPAAEHAEFEVKAARRKWNPALHPRDSKGRFIETGGTVRLWGGKLARVVRALPNDRILVQDQTAPNEFTGRRHTTSSKWVTMVARPDGSAPTDSEDKVREEDEKRIADARRGNGVARDDDGDPDTPDDPHDADDRGRPIGDDDDPVGPREDDDQDEPADGKLPVHVAALPNRPRDAGSRFRDTAALRQHLLDLAEQPGQTPKMTKFLRSVAGDDDHLEASQHDRLLILRDDDTGRWYLTATGTGQRLNAAGDFDTPRDAHEFAQQLNRNTSGSALTSGGFDFSNPDLHGTADSWRSPKGEHIQDTIKRTRQEYDAARPAPAAPAATTVDRGDLKPGDHIKVTVASYAVEWPASLRGQDTPDTVTIEGTLAPTYDEHRWAPLLDATLTAPDGTVLTSGGSVRLRVMPGQVTVSGHTAEYVPEKRRADRVRVGDIVAGGEYGHVITEVRRYPGGRTFTTRSLGVDRETHQFGADTGDTMHVIPRARRRPEDVQHSTGRMEQHHNAADAKRATMLTLKDWAAVNELAEKQWPDGTPAEFRALAQHMQNVTDEPKGAEGYRQNGEAMRGALTAIDDLDTDSLDDGMLRALHRLEESLDANVDRFEADSRAITENKRKKEAEASANVPKPDAPQASGDEPADSDRLEFDWDNPDDMVTLTMPRAVADFLLDEGNYEGKDADTRKALDEAKRGKNGALRVTAPLVVHQILLDQVWVLSGAGSDADPEEKRAHDNYAKRVGEAHDDRRKRQAEKDADAPAAGAPEGDGPDDTGEQPSGAAPAGDPEPYDPSFREETGEDGSITYYRTPQGVSRDVDGRFGVGEPVRTPQGETFIVVSGNDDGTINGRKEPLNGDAPLGRSETFPADKLQSLDGFRPWRLDAESAAADDGTPSPDDPGVRLSPDEVNAPAAAARAAKAPSAMGDPEIRDEIVSLMEAEMANGGELSGVDRTRLRVLEAEEARRAGRKPKEDPKPKAKPAAEPDGMFDVGGQEEEQRQAADFNNPDDQPADATGTPDMIAAAEGRDTSNLRPPQMRAPIDLQQGDRFVDADRRTHTVSKKPVRTGRGRVLVVTDDGRQHFLAPDAEMRVLYPDEAAPEVPETNGPDGNATNTDTPEADAPSPDVPESEPTPAVDEETAAPEETPAPAAADASRSTDAPAGDGPAAAPDQVVIDHSGTGTTVRFPTPNGTVSDTEFAALQRMGFKPSRDRSQPRFFYLQSNTTLSRRTEKVSQLKKWLDERNVAYQEPTGENAEKPELTAEQTEQLKGQFFAPAGTWAVTDFRPGDEVWTGYEWDTVDSLGPKNMRLQSRGSVPYNRVLARRRGDQIRTMFDAPEDDGTPRPGTADPKKMHDERIVEELAQLRGATLPEGNDPSARAVRRQVSARIRALTDRQAELEWERRRNESERRTQSLLVRQPERLAERKAEQVQGRDGTPLGIVYPEKKGKWRIVDRDGRLPSGATYPTRAAAITALHGITNKRNERAGEGWKHSAWDDVQAGDTVRVPELGRAEGTGRTIVAGWGEPIEVSEVSRGDLGQVLLSGRRGDENVTLEIGRAHATYGTSKPGTVPDPERSDAGGGMPWQQMRPEDFGQDETPAPATGSDTPRPTDEFGTPDLIANGQAETTGGQDEPSIARTLRDGLPELPPLPNLTGLSRQNKDDVRRIRGDYDKVRTSLDGILAGDPPTGDAREDLRRVREQLDFIAGRLSGDHLPDAEAALSTRARLHELGQDLDRALAALPAREPEPQGDGPNGGTLFHPWDVPDGELVRFDAENPADRNRSLASYYGSFRGAASASGAQGRTLASYVSHRWNDDRQRWEDDQSHHTVTMPSRGLVERFTPEQWDAWRRPEQSDDTETADAATAPDAPIRDTSPADMSDEDITAEFEELQAWQDRHVTSTGEGPRVQGNLVIALSPVANRRERLEEEQNKRHVARRDRERKEKEKQERAAALARAEIGKRSGAGSYPVTVDGERAGTVKQLAGKWEYTDANGRPSADFYKSRAEAVAALVRGRDLRQEQAAEADRQEEARSEAPEGWVLGDRAEVAENDIIRVPRTRTGRDGRPYPEAWGQPARVTRVERRDDGSAIVAYRNVDGSQTWGSPLFLNGPDDTFAWASDRTRPEPTPKWHHELRARMADIGDDIATLQNREGLQDPERIQRLQDLIQRVSRAETDDLQADLRQIRDEAAWIESQFDDPDLELPYETRRTRSWATAARMKAERDLGYSDFQHGSVDEPSTAAPGPERDDRSSRAQGLFGDGMNAVGGESLPEMQELNDRLDRVDSAEDRDAELRDIADRMDALAEQYELAGPQGEHAADRFRRAARAARGEQDDRDERRGDDEDQGDDSPSLDGEPDNQDDTTSTPEDDEQQDDEQNRRQRPAADPDGGAADPDGEPDGGGAGTPDSPGSDSNDGEGRRRRRNSGNGGGGPGGPDVGSLRNAWRTGDGLTPAEDTPERRAHLAALADRDGLTLSPKGGLATYPEPQADGSTMWRFAQARNGTNLPGLTLASDDPEEARALAGRFEEITDRNGDPFDWHAAWGPANLAAWRDGEGRNLPQALRAVQDDYEQERTGAFTLPEDLTSLSDPELEAAALQGLGPDDTLRVMAEMDRRDGFVDERIRTAVPETPPANAEEAEREGRAMDESLRFGDTDITQPAPATPGRMRREFDALDEERFQAAMQATDGRLFTPEAEGTGVDPRDLFSGRKVTAAQARNLASQELRDWWDDNGGRLTYSTYSQREQDRVLRAEFADIDEARYQAALEYTNGYFFARKYKYADNVPSERDLFSGGSVSGFGQWRQYASEELLEWYDNNGGRLTFNEYKKRKRQDDRRAREEYEAEQNQRQEPPVDEPDSPAEEPSPSAPAETPAYDPAVPRFADLKAVRDHIRDGQLDPPATADPTVRRMTAEERAQIADDGKNTRLSRGGRLVVYGNLEARTGTTDGRRYRVAVPGSLTSLLSEEREGFGTLKDALAAANLVEEQVRDADGQPFPWDAPDAAARARAFRTADGDNLVDAIARALAADPDTNKYGQWNFEMDRAEERRSFQERADAWGRKWGDEEGYTVVADPADLQEGDEVVYVQPSMNGSMAPGPQPLGTARGTLAAGRVHRQMPTGIQGLGAADYYIYQITKSWTDVDGTRHGDTDTVYSAHMKLGVVRRKPRPEEVVERPRGGDEEQTTNIPPSPEPPAPDEPVNAPEDTPRQPAEPDPEPEPEPIGGQPAHWARVEDLVPGDMVRMDGTTKKGRPIQRAGYVYTPPVRVEVTRRGRTQYEWRTWVTENSDGTGAAGNVYTSANAAAARAEAPDDVVPGSPANGAQTALRSGDLPNQIPADRDGRGLFPGSTVTGTNDREGAVTGATDTTVSVHWSDGNDDTAVSPTTLTVTNGQRPDGWTANGQRVTTHNIVSNTDGALLGPVDDVDGDSVTITTADGTITRSAGDLRITGEVRDDTPAPVTGIDEPAAADLKDGDVVLLDLDGHLAAVAITSPPSRDGDRISLQYADTTTGEIGEIDVDARAVLTRAQGQDGGAPDLGPDDAPTPDDDLTVHPTPHTVDPVTGPTVDPGLTTGDRTVIGDHADGPDDEPDAHQAAVRITADLPVTPEQATALATRLRAAADPSTPEGRAALRAADHLDHSAGRTPPANLDRPRPSNAAQSGEGDLIAMPDERHGDQVRVFRVIDAEDAPGGLRSFLLEDEDQQWRRRIVHGAMPVWQLPEAAPDPVTPPDIDDTDGTPDTSAAPATPSTPAAPTAPVARVRPGSLRAGDVIDAPVSRTGYQFNGHRRLTIISEPQRNGWWMQLTGVDDDGAVHDFGLHNGRAVNVYDRNRPTPALPPVGTPRDPNQAPQADADRIVSDHARTVAARIIDEAVAGTEPPAGIHALREQIAQRLTADALRNARESARSDASAALDAASITGRDRANAQRRLRRTREQAHADTVRAALRTINDLEPLDGESNEDLAARARDLLRLIPAQVAGRPSTDPGADPDVRNAVTGHAHSAVNGLLQQLRAAGVNPADAERMARLLARQMSGSRQATARQIAARVAAANPDAGRQPGLMARIVALLVRMAKRLAELVKAGARKIAEKYRDARERLARLRAFLGRMVRRVRQFPESRRLARLHRAVNLPDADGNSLAARISHWAGLMPEPGRFGQSQRRVTFWRPTTWGQLAAGRLPDRSDRIQWGPDRAADGGPGLTALRHMAALRAAGDDVDQDVTRRLSAALGDDFGDDPHSTLQHADDYVATSERRLVTLQAARSGATIPDDEDLEVEIAAARDELATARRDYADLRTRYAAAVPDAVAAALADIRDMGPEGGNAIVFGPDTDPDAERAVRGVQRLIPRAWLTAPESRRLTAVNGNQGRYEPDGQQITVADLADDGMGTAGYALAQHFARHLGDLDAAQRAFWFSRTHTGRPGARRMRPSALDRLLRRWQQQTQPETGDSLARSVQAMFSGDWYQDDDLRAFLLGLMATR